MKKYVVVILLLVGVILISGCNKGSKKDGIVGTWVNSGSYVYTFNDDKTCTYDVAGTLMKCTYETDGDKLSILYKDSDVPFETTYSIEGSTLIIKDSFGNDVKYDKK